MSSLESVFQNFVAKQQPLFDTLATVGRQIASSAAAPIIAPLPLKNPRAIILIGMGGSALGAQLLASLYREELAAPLIVENSYSLPAFANTQTLVILSSYSGTTEETLTAYIEARKRKLPCAVLAGGGELLARAKKDGVNFFSYDLAVNPSGQPRLGVGLSIGGALTLLGGVGALKNTTEKIQKLKSAAESAASRYAPEIPAAKNPAKKFARLALNKVLILVASEHLVGNCHLLQNQIHESAKHFAACFPLSELNHHLMEGLSHPLAAVKNLRFIFFKSRHYRSEIAARYPLTARVVKKQGASASDYIFPNAVRSPEQEVMEELVFGGYFSSYLAALHGVNPGDIPWVDYFKNALKK